MINLLVLLVLGIAAYRITRFLVIDTLFEGSRNKFHTWLANKQGMIYDKILDLTSCTWCLGFWVSLVLYSFYLWECPIDFNRLEWISTFAIAGVQGMLHALEPGDD